MKRKTNISDISSKKQKLSQEEEDMIKYGSNDTGLCASMYIKQITSPDSISSIRKTPYLTQKSTTEPIVVINLNTRKFEKQTTAFKTSDKISGVFESVFGDNADDLHLNTEVIRVGAIVRIWNTRTFKTLSESHSTCTIDYGDRRVSFGTSLPSGKKVLIDGKEAGKPHLTLSPDPDFVNKILRTGIEGAYPARSVQLVAMGYLTQNHINLMKKILIDKSDVMTRSSETFIRINNTYYPILCTERISEHLFYNAYFNICNVDKNKIVIVDSDDNIKDIRPRNNLKSTNCTGLMVQLFPGIVCLNSSHHLITVPHVFNSPSPASLIPSKMYKCTDKANVLIDPSVVNIGWSRGFMNNMGMCSYRSVNEFIKLIVYTALYLLPSYTVGSKIPIIIPLEYIPNGMSYLDIMSNTAIISAILLAVSSIKIYTNFPKSSSFSFDGNGLSYKELVDLYGEDYIKSMINLLGGQTHKNNTNLGFHTKSIRRKKSIKKSRSRRNSSPIRRKKSTKKSRSRRNSSPIRRKKNIVRHNKSIKKSRRRRM
jgi:hypothetical protein